MLTGLEEARGSDVVGRAFALASGQREGRLALGLREAAGQLGEGLDQGVALGDAHLPQLHLLAARPLLRRLLLHLTPLPQVRLVPQHDDRHLGTDTATSHCLGIHLDFIIPG